MTGSDSIVQPVGVVSFRFTQETSGIPKVTGKHVGFHGCDGMPVLRIRAPFEQVGHVRSDSAGGAADRNPMREIEGISGTRGGGAKALSSHELRRFLTDVNGDVWAIEHDLPALIMFMAATGARIGEACAVRWEDVDLETGTVTIARTVTRIAGQGLVRKTKTAAGACTLTLVTPLVGVLVERRVQHHAVSTGIVFPPPSGKLRDPSNTQHDLAKLRDRLGFPDVQWHSFRKTVATALKDAGVDPRDRADY